ncbi:MAG: DUF4058 family protein [Gemmataceae bacterium]|nr:DUF4058 family protein [Gemmataceae bacterium]
MPSPMPGMDPYLEDDKLWPLFHTHLVHSLYQLLLPGLMDRYRARLAERKYVVEQALFTSVVREDHREPYLEVRQRADGRLITVVDVVSPANKGTASGRRAYLDKRQEFRQQNASLVEIDLVLQGSPVQDFSREGLPDWDYAVAVTRSVQPERYEIYTATVDKRLPRFRLPLASDDRDTVLDLQAAVARSYDQGDFAKQIDYARDPLTRLNDTQKKWLSARLHEQKLRQ